MDKEKILNILFQVYQDCKGYEKTEKPYGAFCYGTMKEAIWEILHKEEMFKDA